MNSEMAIRRADKLRLFFSNHALQQKQKLCAHQRQLLLQYRSNKLSVCGFRQLAR